MTYLYDGTFEGLLTILCLMFQKKMNVQIKTEKTFKEDLFTEYEFIETDYQLSDKLMSIIKRRLNDEILYDIYITFLSNDENKEDIIFDYLKNAFKIGIKIKYYRTINSVIEREKIHKRVTFEVHRFKGFVRFKECDNNVLYASINPDNDIVELLGPHFKNRFKHYNWVIHDTTRNKAIFYNQKVIELVDTSNYDLDKLNFSYEEQAYQEMWKAFYKSVAIKERKNKKCQLNFMPKRYWVNLFETEE